jgi:hypothetical protein
MLSAMPATDADLDAVYAAIPDAGCRGLCVIGCTSVAMAPAEQHRIADRHHINLPLATAPPGAPTLIDGQQTADHCPALSPSGRCTVYPDRPLVCRLYGATEGLPCPFGCVPAEGLLTRGQATRLLRRVITIPQ